MREILFRGKTSKGEWCEGLPTRKKPFDKEINRIQLIDDYLENYFTEFFLVKDVLPETVGQYTGLCDQNGKKIFEGDIVKAQDDVFGSPFCDGIIGKIVYDEAAFFIETQNIIDSQYLFNECAVYEVIGNIHDNPELLKGE